MPVSTKRSSTLPLGASRAKAGTAMHVGQLSQFSQQAFGVEQTLLVYALVQLTGALAAVVTAPVPSASLFMLAAVLSAVDDKASRRAVYASDFPAGEGREIAGRACVLCHSASRTTQQAMDSTGWEKTLTQMEKWGVKLTPAEHDTLRRYLLGHYGAKAKPTQP